MQHGPHDARDPYEVLGLDPRAPKELVDEAYWLHVGVVRQLQAGVDPARISELTRAYGMIATTEGREAYAAASSDRDRPGSVVSQAHREHDRSVASRTGRPQDCESYYDLLRVNVNADPAVIDLALRVMTRYYGDSPQARAALDNARRTLLAPELRAAYDASLRGSRLLHAPVPGSSWAAASAAPGHFRYALSEGPLDAPPATVSRRTATLDDDVSARRVLTGAQKLVGIALVLATLAGLALAPQETFIALISAVTALYLVSIAYKTHLAASSLRERDHLRVEPEFIASIPDDALPVYTVLVPLYHEAPVLRALVASIEALDYPKDKLDVKLLLEEDDEETRTALSSLRLPPYIETLTVPDVGPKGKPRACNYGLIYARGLYLALYDAEDRPQADQLKKALVAFATSGRDVACVQAKLDFYNADQNLLTKWFTIEYTTWFNLYLPALQRLRVPIPLGGTSNHFRVDWLRAIGAWDAYNVTEDADLGLRLARSHFSTVVIDSVTYEEANSRFGNWLRQRSRWIKGYMQTWLVHMRHPGRLYDELGAAGFLAFQVMVLGTFGAYFVNPVFWALLIAWFVTHAAGIQAVYPAPLLYASTVAFFAGNFLFIFTAVAGSLHRGYYHGVKYALAIYVYWALMSLAAWKAMFELVTRPHYWEKTEHGLDASPAPEGVGEPR